MVTLRIFYGIGIILFVFNIFFAIHNIVKYLVRRKIGGRLIHLFYFVVIVINMALLSQYIIFIIRPNYDRYRLYITREVPYVGLLDLVIMSSMFMIGTIILVKMYQLSLSIRLFIGLLSTKASKMRKYNIYVFSIACNLLYAALTIFIECKQNDIMMSIAGIVFYVLLTVCYSLTIIHL